MLQAFMKAKYMAVLVYAVVLLVVMPALIYGSLAWVLRAARRRDRQ